MVDAGAGACGELVVEVGGLLLLHAGVGVERPPSCFDPAVNAVDPLVPVLLRHPLPVALCRLDVHADGERPRRLHEVQQPPEPGLLGGVRDVEALLGVLADLQAVPVDADSGGADRLRKGPRAGLHLLRGLARCRAVHDVGCHEARGQSSVRLTLGVEPLGEQVEHLEPVERTSRQARRFEVGPDAFGVAQRVTDGSLTCGRGLGWPAAAPCCDRRPPGGPPRADDEVAQPERLDGFGAVSDGALVSDPERPDRLRPSVLAGVLCRARCLLGAVCLDGEDLLELERRGLRVELH